MLGAWSAQAGFPWNYPPPPPPCEECPCPPGSGGAGGSSGGGGAGGGGGRGGHGGFGGFGGGGCSTCSVNSPSIGASGSTGGMPDWKVNEPNIDLRIHDEPLAYQSSVGRVSFQIDYWQRDDRTPSANVFTLGQGWECSWQGYVATDGNPDDPVMLYAAGGGEMEFDDLTGATPSYYQNQRMQSLTDTNGNLTGYELFHPSGAVDYYNFLAADTNGVVSQAYLSQKIDAQGHATTFIYSPFNPATGVVQLNYVVDPDGKTNTLSYTNNGTYSYLISQVQDPFGHTVSFAYDTNGFLTNVTDVAGLSSSFSYGSFPGSDNWTHVWDGYEWYVETVYNPTNYWLNQLTTPYGTTSFTFTDDSLANYDVANRSVIITEPNGSHQMFVHRGYTSFIGDIANPTGIPSSTPDGSGLDDGWLMVYRNSFYWGRQQFANLSAGFQATGATNWDLTQLTTTDYVKARWQKWAHASDGGQSDALTMEQDPSPDGTAPGEMTWFTYPNPDYGAPYYQGSSSMPSLTIKVLPDGSQWYEQYQTDQWGNRTNIISTWTQPDGSVGTRTNSYIYAANGQDLLAKIRVDGVTATTYSYDYNHQVVAMTNALGEVTRYTYNANEQLTSTTLPSGLVTTNIYGANGFLAQQIAVGFSTNSYTYTNGLVYTHTDERGLTVTNTWDALQRPTKVSYPDGTSESYTYNKLDLAKIVDRMGFATGYGYNQIRQKIFETNALGNVTSYAYCDCGGLDSITDPLGNATHFSHDNQGNIIQTIYPDGYVITNQYNLLRQLTKRADSSSAIWSYTYNNQGLQTTISNAIGQVIAVAFNMDDRPTSTVDANGVSVILTYDNLNRPTSRTWPDGGVESYGFTPNAIAPTSYTNQIGNVTLYSYDALSRKINEVHPNVKTNQFGYNGAGDLLTLTDGDNHTTRWNYDLFGRVTNKMDALNHVVFNFAYDADNRLTNRWTPEKGNTFYNFDAVGNLLQVRYPQQTNFYAFDALNQLTNMVDALGSHNFSHDAVGELLSESGLWTNDIINVGYTNRLRVSLGVGSSWSQNYGYDLERRLISINSPAGAFNYQFLTPASLLPTSISLPNGAKIVESYDSAAQLQETDLKNYWGHILDGYGYQFNLASERTNITRNLGLTASTVNAGYDSVGELTSWNAAETNGETRLNEQLAWAYDAAGNLHLRTNGALIQTFGVDMVNELTNVTRIGSLTLTGTTPAPATNVTVNGLAAQVYGDFAFARTNLGLLNGNNTFTNVAVNLYGGTTTNIFTANLPSNVGLSYDSNGNLTNDGIKSLSYDAENQLTNAMVSGQWKVDFIYDGLNRRRVERDYNWNGSAWVKTNEIHLIYDSYLLVQERDINNNVLVTYTRGLDLSGRLKGAGGVGGLLARTDTAGSVFYHADAVGNVTALMDVNQNIVGRYMYGAFGKLTGMWGTMAPANEMRFSSKPYNPLTDDYDYGFRRYRPDLQRWSNRDPIQEWGGINLFGFVGNKPLNAIDFLGLQPEAFDPIEIDPPEPTPDPYGYGPGGQVPRPMPTRNPSGFNGLGDINNEWNHLEPPEPGENNDCPQLSAAPPPPPPPRPPSPPLPPERGCSTCSVNTIPFQVTAPPKPAPPINWTPIIPFATMLNNY